MNTEPDDDGFAKALAEVIDRLADQARQKARETEPWKGLFAASEHGLRGLLSEANTQMRAVVRNTVNVICERFGVAPGNELYRLIQALPFAWAELEVVVSTEQGSCCSVDKVRKVYEEAVSAAIQRLAGGQQEEKVLPTAIRPENQP